MVIMLFKVYFMAFLISITVMFQYYLLFEHITRNYHHLILLVLFLIIHLSVLHFCHFYFAWMILCISLGLEIAMRFFVLLFSLYFIHNPRVYLLLVLCLISIHFLVNYELWEYIYNCEILEQFYGLDVVLKILKVKWFHH